MGLFSAGWLTFTTLHALVMIRGTSQIFGFGALFLLLFYGIFWAVGLGMAWAAVMAASQETLTLEGDQITLTRRLMAWRWTRRFTVRRDSRAVLLPANVRQSGSNAMEVALYDGEGKEVRFASGRPLLEQEKLVERLNTHLSALRA